MHVGQASHTARGVAFLRALEQARPPNERMLHDPFALGRVQTRLGRHLACYPSLQRLFDALVPGLPDHIPARDRFADDCIDSAVLEGVRQLVVLGAGFDTIALRSMQRGHALDSFEVDHPATLKAKLAGDTFLREPRFSVIRQLAVDFEQGNLTRDLQAAGLRGDKPSVIVLLGVFYYLSSDALRSTLRAVSELSSPGSWFVFDFWPASGGPVDIGTGSGWKHRMRRRWFRKRGEAVMSLVDPGALHDLLDPYGFDILEQKSLADVIQQHRGDARRLERAGHVAATRKRVSMVIEPRTDHIGSPPPSQGPREFGATAA